MVTDTYNFGNAMIASGICQVRQMMSIDLMVIVI
jgi:hypothetical protein